MIDLGFTVIGARVEPQGATPTLLFKIRIQSTNGAKQVIHAVLLRCLLQIEPRRRAHSPSVQGCLEDVFGEAERWRDTLKPLIWARVSVNVLEFEDAVEIELPVACTYDFDVAAAKYLAALEDGDIPLRFLFSGTVFAKAENGFRVEQVSWDKEAAYRMPVRVWRQAMDQYFPECTWIRIRRESLDALQRFRARKGLLSWDDAIEELVGLEQQQQGAAR